MQNYELSTLRTGERVISEKVAERPLGLARLLDRGRLARRDRRPRRGVALHRAPALQGHGRYSAQQIAEIFDGLGGELNAATSRETTVVYARVPDERLETALDVMAEMVFEPASRRSTPSARSCSRRSRWSRTTRRTSSTTSSPRPSSAPTARAAGDRARRGDLDASAVAARRVPRGVYAARTSSWRPPATSSTTRLVELLARRAGPEAPRASRAAARAPARPGSASSQGHRAVPRLPRRAGRLAERRAPLRRVAARRDRRRLRVVAALPGDPREARHGVRRLQLRLPVRGPARSASTSARARTTSAVPRDRGRASWPTSRRATCARASSSARRRT